MSDLKLDLNGKYEATPGGVSSTNNNDNNKTSLSASNDKSSNPTRNDSTKNNDQTRNNIDGNPTEETLKLDQQKSSGRSSRNRNTNEVVGIRIPQTRVTHYQMVTIKTWNEIKLYKMNLSPT